MKKKKGLQKNLIVITKLLVILIIVFVVLFSLFYLYKIINNFLSIQLPALSKGGFDLEKFKKFAPRFGIEIE